MKFIFKGAILSLLAVSFVACSDDEDPDYWTPPFSTTQGAFILNNGIWGQNDASIAYYDKETQTASSANVFESMNDGLRLGDTAQEILVTGNKMYIAVSGSGIIYVTDLKCAVIDSIKSSKGGELQQPRAFATYGNYVYVTYYDGYVARINKNTNKLDANQVAVGRNPENLKIAKGKIYVANTGGMDYPNYDDKVSVVDIASFSKLRDIEVIFNPEKVEVDKDGNIYVISMGNHGYGEVPVYPTLQRIDTDADTVKTVVGPASYMRISPKGDKLYYMNLIYDNWILQDTESKIYDTKTGEVEAGNFISDEVVFADSPTSFNIDPQTGDFYIGVSPYGSKSTMYIVSSTTGKLVKSFSTGGYNVWGAFFVK